MIASPPGTNPQSLDAERAREISLLSSCDRMTVARKTQRRNRRPRNCPAQLGRRNPKEHYHVRYGCEKLPVTDSTDFTEPCLSEIHVTCGWLFSASQKSRKNGDNK
jgi:hypothetical protein